MNRNTIREMLTSTDTETLVDLNDWAVNTLRQHCYDHGYNPSAILAAERTRMDGKGFDDYVSTPRIGARTRMNRKVKMACYAVVATREALANLPEPAPTPAPAPVRKSEPERELTPEESARMDEIIRIMFGDDFAANLGK